MSYSFRFLDDIALADMAFEAEGDSAQELCRGATDALLEALADPVTIGTTWERSLVHASDDLGEALFEWLSEIVYWKDAAGVVFHDACVDVAHDQGVWKLEGCVRGAPVDSVRQRLRNDVKGVTKHLYHVIQEKARWKARVVLDV